MWPLFATGVHRHRNSLTCHALLDAAASRAAELAAVKHLPATKTTSDPPCYQDDLGPAHSALDLFYVCSRVHRVLSGDPLFWGQARMLRPSLIDAAMDHALSCDHPYTRLSFAAQGGVCLCIQGWLLQNIEFVTRIDLALPSTNIDDVDSPSHMIRKELQEDPPHVPALDSRFDWGHAHADARQTTILLPAVTTCRLLHATFSVAGKALTLLFLAAEAQAFRWTRADVLAILRECPNLETVAMQMI